MARGDSKQMEILQCIYDFQTKKGYPPTIREIGEEVNLASPSTVHGHVSRLGEKGLINKEGTKTRAIEITQEGLNILGIGQEDKIPMIGVVTAGNPILAVEDPQTTEFFPIPDDLKKYQGDLFMLTVEGTSMINVGILDGDEVIVRRQNQASNGDIVVAMTSENEATVKRFFKETGHYRLQPENDTMKPIILDQVSILGKVMGLYRSTIY